MDSQDFRAILSRSRVEIWELIETAIQVANSDYGEELRRRRDKIVEALYTPPSQLCRSCNGRVHDEVVEEHQYCPDNKNNFDYNIDTNIVHKKSGDDDSNRNLNEDCSKSPRTPESNNPNFSGGDEQDLDPYGGLFDYEQTKIRTIKEQLEDPHQTEDAVVNLLEILADMDITFQALKESDIGRHVNRLRKHPSSEVRRLVKMVVRRWKETVDEWVKVNQPQASSNLLADGESPQQNIPKNPKNGHHQVPDFSYSPNPQNGSSSAERSYAEHEPKPKPPQSVPRRETASRPQSIPKSSSAPPNRAQRESMIDDERLNSARRRLQENYQEAENGVILRFGLVIEDVAAPFTKVSIYTDWLLFVLVYEAKKQRTIQVMDIHEIPKPKNAFFAKNKGGFQGRLHH